MLRRNIEGCMTYKEEKDVRLANFDTFITERIQKVRTTRDSMYLKKTRVIMKKIKNREQKVKKFK